MLPHSVDFKAPRQLLNLLSKAVPGRLNGSGEHIERNCLQDRANFHRFHAWQIVLICNAAIHLYLKPAMQTWHALIGVNNSMEFVRLTYTHCKTNTRVVTWVHIFMLLHRYEFSVPLVIIHYCIFYVIYLSLRIKGTGNHISKQYVTLSFN